MRDRWRQGDDSLGCDDAGEDMGDAERAVSSSPVPPRSELDTTCAPRLANHKLDQATEAGSPR